MSRLTRLAAVVLIPVIAVWLFAGCGGSSNGTVTGNTSPQATSLTLTPDSTGSATQAPVVTVTSATPDTQTRVLIGYKTQHGASEESAIRGMHGTIHHSFTIAPVIAATVSGTAIEQLKRDPKVAFIEPDAIATASSFTDSVPWGVAKINASAVQNLVPANTGAGVKIAIIDTGIDYTHPDLAPVYKGGYNFVKNTTDPKDDNGHGTHVAGIIAAAQNNYGIVGVAPGASIYSLKVLDASGSGSYSAIIAALQWCANKSNGIKVASMSLGGTSGSTALQTACTNAYNAGVLLVAAAGNSGSTSTMRDSVEYPARYASVIAVGATDQSNVRPYWSSTGAEVNIAAPGVNINSTWLGGGYKTLSGTSMACPHVTGTAALVIASGVTGPAAIRTKLDTTATDLGTKGLDVVFGYGLDNALKATGH